MSRRKPQSPIFTEWERLVFEIKRKDQDRTRLVREPWRSLWNTYIEGNALANTSIHDAELICSLGWQIAMQEGDFGEAAERITRWFEHPDLAECDPNSHTMFLDELAESWFYAGDEESAFGLYAYLINELPKRYVTIVRMSAASVLYIHCSEQRAGELAPPEVATKVSNVLLAFPGYKRTVDSIITDDSTFGELSTYLAWLFVDANNRRYRPYRVYPTLEDGPGN